jgi:hypothetical protein
MPPGLPGPPGKLQTWATVPLSRTKSPGSLAIAFAAVQFAVSARSRGIAGEPTTVPSPLIVPPSPPSPPLPEEPASPAPIEEPLSAGELPPDPEPPDDEEAPPEDELDPGGGLTPPPASWEAPDPDPLALPDDVPEGPAVGVDVPHAAVSEIPHATTKSGATSRDFISAGAPFMRLPSW